MSDDPQGKSAIDSGAFSTVPVELTVSVGVARLSIGELLDFDKGRVIPLDRNIDDPVRIYVGDRLIGTGELEELEEGSGRIGVRILEIGEDADRRDAG